MSLREVEFYELTKSTWMLAAGEPFLLHRITGSMPFPIGGNQWLASTETVQRKAIPVSHIRTWKGDRFVAIEPELADVLEAPFRQPLLDAKAELALEVAKKTLAEADVRILNRRINEFCALPWYRRVWRAVFGGIA